jgi:hypothetical protein
MKKQLTPHIAGTFVGLTLLGATPVLHAEVQLLGAASFAGNATDKSNDSQKLEGGAPANRLGGISAIEYSGADDLYLVLSDRGPADGATSYRCRFHVMRLAVSPGSATPVTADLVSTIFLRNEQGQNLVGLAAAFDEKQPNRGLRFDPESIRGVKDRFYMSDEYGPFIAEFSTAGDRQRLLGVPVRFQAMHPAATPQEEARLNTSGRQTNAGLEGMAITPNRGKLLAIMQRPLLQDSAPGPKPGKRRGRNNRVLQIDLADGRTREYVYVLEDDSYGVSEVLAINDHEFLVLERDGKGGDEAECKRIYKIDVTGASEVGDIDSLLGELPERVKPVSKTLLVDLLDPRYGIRGPNCPEKMEGLAFGPNLPDGRRLLILACDSDFDETRPTVFYAFAVDRNDLPRFGWSL